MQYDLPFPDSRLDEMKQRMFQLQKVALNRLGGIDPQVSDFLYGMSKDIHEIAEKLNQLLTD